MPLRTELHTHTADDPFDFIPHSAVQLIDRAADLGYGALAITLHEKQFDIRSVASHARDRGVVLIPGIERSLHGRHTLLLNFPPSVERVSTFEEVRRLKAQSGGLVIAPHPFFPIGKCLGTALDEAPELFDAIEVNAFYTRRFDFNQRAIRWAKAHGKPLVGNGDVHRLAQLGTTCSLVDAEPDADAICEAIRAGRVKVETRPISLFRAGSLFAELMTVDTVWRLRGGPAAKAREALSPEP